VTTASIARTDADPIAKRAAATRPAERAVTTDHGAMLLDLPPLPHAVAEVMRALHDEQLSLEHCRAVIETDPALAVSLVRAANAPVYGQAGRVADVVQALRLLGLRAVIGLMLTVAMHDWARACPRALVTLAHMTVVANVARSVAARAGVARDEAFLAGLLHDTGLVLLQIALDAPDTTDGIDDAAGGPGHVEIGRAALLGWGLPTPLVDAIARHHEPQWLATDAPPNLSAVVAVANALACLAQQWATATPPAPLRAADSRHAASHVDAAPGTQDDAEWPSWIAGDIPELLDLARGAVNGQTARQRSPSP
jgi:HD-like signal output (HDOD) protein